MKTIITISLAFLTFFGCDKEKGEVVCSSAEFIFVNQNGDDIFNPNTSNYLELSEFAAYTKDSINTLNFTDTLNGMNVFDIWLHGEIEKEGITYFKFGNITIDTVYAKLKERGNSIFISELYYNDSLIEKNKSVGECGDTHMIIIKVD
jgi:hypothetical protein